MKNKKSETENQIKLMILRFGLLIVSLLYFNGLKHNRQILSFYQFTGMNYLLSI